jgi:cytochrome P450
VERKSQGLGAVSVDPEDWAHNIFTAGVEDHARQRWVLAPVFSDKDLREQEPLIQGIVGLLIEVGVARRARK